MSTSIEISQKFIENRIFTIRGSHVMLDNDLAGIYNVETRVLNQAVKRNKERFPDDFMFQLTQEEWDILKSQRVASSLRSQDVILEDNRGKHRKYLPFVFTEQGVAGLSGVLKSQMAAKVHVAIMRAFVSLRKLLQENQLLFARLDTIERKQLETDHKLEQVFKSLERRDVIPNQGVFFEGQIFDAYEIASKIIRSAKQNIVLIDNYMDESTIIHLSKKMKGVSVLLLTKVISKSLELDVKKANKQYGGFRLKSFTQSHDRFIIIDETNIYHLGASLKDLGNKWFAFSKMDKSSVKEIMESVSELV